MAPRNFVMWLFVCIMEVSVLLADEVYFSTLDDIRVLADNEAESRVLFDDQHFLFVKALDCNSNVNDHQIYWINSLEQSGISGVIKRGFPDSRNAENVLNLDLHDPKGLAVDWSTSNVYFSHRPTQESGRIEVVSSDGRKRRVLFSDLREVGPVAVNVLSGHLYFMNDFNIYRSHLDGSELQVVVFGWKLKIMTFHGLAVDEQANVLYWIDSDMSRESFVRSLSIVDFENHSSEFCLSDVHVLYNSTVHSYLELYVQNYSLYLTIPQDTDSPGAVLHARMVPAASVGGISGSDLYETGELLLEGNQINPQGVCTFQNMTDMSSPCSEGNNYCSLDAFCFTVPGGSGGTTAKCSCPTGLRLNSNNISCSSVPKDFLLFTRVFSGDVSHKVSHTEVRLVSLEDEATSMFVDIQLPIYIRGTEAVYVSYDHVQHKVYWTELDPPAIKRANLNGTNTEVFISSSIAHPESLVVDPYTGNIYWADSRLDRICVAKLNQPRIRKTLFDGLIQPHGLALDIDRGYIYWSDLNPNYPVVEKALMNGQNRTVISSVDIRSPTNVAVDMLTGDVYWIDYDSENRHNSKIVRFSFSSLTESNVHIDHTFRMAFGLAVHGDYLYWTDRDTTVAPLARAPKSGGSNAAEILLKDVSGSLGLVAVNTETINIETGCRRLVSNDPVEGSCDQLCLPSGIKTSPTCACIDHHHMNEMMECEDSSAIFFVTCNSSIQQLQLIDRRLRSSGNNLVLESDVVKAIDGDLLDNMLYWIDENDQTIKRRGFAANSSVQHVVSCCLAAPEDLAVDWMGRNLYWTDSARRVIEVSRLNGDSRSVHFEIEDSLGPPGLLVLDPFRGYIYWSSKTEPKIYRLRMDGSQEEAVLYRSFASTSANITAMALNFTDNGVFLFWAVNDTDPNSRYVIIKSDLLLTKEETPTIVHSQRNRIYDLYVLKDTIYIISNTRNRQSIYTILANEFGPVYSPSAKDSTFTHFIVLHHTIMPGSHVCQIDSKCDGGALCLVTNEASRTCQCDVLRIKTNIIPHKRETCTLTRSFLLLATEQYIHYLPVPDGDVTNRGSVRPLHFVPMGKVADMAYDPVNHSVMWVENGSNILHSVALNGRSRWSIPFSTRSQMQPFSLAYDWMGGHIFLTDANSFEIKVVTVNGEGRGSMLEAKVDDTRGSILHKPGELAVDSRSSLLYYTTRERLSDVSRDLNSLPLSDISNVKSIPLHGSKIGMLTFEPHSKSFYWLRYKAVDSSDGGGFIGDAIERYFLADGTVQLVKANASGVEALTALTNQGVTYVYWYDRTDQYLYRHSSFTERYLQWVVPSTTKVVRIIGHTNISSIPKDPPCLASQRPCSHLCIPYVPFNSSSSNFKCACPASSKLMDRNSTHCSVPSCGRFQFPCDDEFGTCFPTFYFCDGIEHCYNGTDEICPCNRNLQNGCYDESGTSEMCFSLTERCDGHPQCRGGEDEKDCCKGTDFGCYVSGNPPWNFPFYQCLDNMSLCDKVKDCQDGRDEYGCDAVSATQPTIEAPSPPPSVADATIIITLIIISIITIVVVVVLIVSGLRLVWKRRAEGRAHHSISYCMQTQLRTDSQSDYSSEISHGTNTTQVGNGSAMSHCANKTSGGMTNQMHMLNPPPSPISTIQHLSHSLALSEDDNLSNFSQTYSEYAAPPPPCPSINYDNVSGNMSSVSNQYHQHQVGFRQPGRNPNPLLSRNSSQQHYNYMLGNGGMPYLTRCQNGAPPSHQSSHFSSSHYQYRSGYGQGHAPYSDITELDTVTHTETESTLSIVTENPDVFQYDTSMPHPPPPGRPPSPVTVYSEYQGQPPLSLRSSSSSSFSSQD